MLQRATIDRITDERALICRDVFLDILEVVDELQYHTEPKKELHVGVRKIPRDEKSVGENRSPPFFNTDVQKLVLRR